MIRARSQRALAAAALALTLGVLAAPPAAGHASQTGSSPAAGAVLDAVPSFVEVTFDTPLMDVGAALVVRTADGTVVSEAPEVDREVVRAAVAPGAPPGVYTVAFRVVSQDGHPITSTFGFTITGDVPSPSAVVSSPAATTPVASSPAATSAAAPSGGPPYALIAGGLLVLTLIVGGAIALRR